MWKIAFALLIALTTVCGCATSYYTKIQERSDFLQKNYPFTLLGEDYGLLTDDDLAISSCVAKSEPFSVRNFTPHPYWQCFSTQNADFICDVGETDENGVTAILAIVLKKDGIIHEYLSRRAISLEVCKEFASEWRRLTEQQEYVCISGQFINPSKGESDANTLSWIFESYKTAKGCDSYFEGGCSLAYKIKKGCNPAETTQGNDKRKN